MFIKAIPKIDRNTGKSYNYYRLCESYRLGGKVRHRTIISLGSLVELSDSKDFKLLADRIEQLVGGNLPLYPTPPVVEALAHRFYNQIIEAKLVDRVPEVFAAKNFETVDLDSVELENVRETGSEWMCLQTAKELGLREYFESAGFTPGQCDLSLAHIISRAVHPASEHATVDWLNDNSVHCAN